MKKKTSQQMLPGFEVDAGQQKPDAAPKSTGDTPVAPLSEVGKSAAPNPRRVVREEVDPAGKTVYVLDAFSLIFQVFHALPEMTGPSGQPVSAIFGIARDVLELIERRKPDFLFCAYDLPGPTFRNELYGEYKMHRKEMPEDLVPQIDEIRRLMEVFDVPVLAHEGFEADDILATVARITGEVDASCWLVTTDKDCRQLITDKVVLYNIRKDEEFAAEQLAQAWGVTPGQVVDFQALVGDSTDNVPGVPLIGPKIVRELLEQYGTLEGVLDNADKISGKKRKENLMNGREMAMLSRQLVRLSDDVPIEIDWPAGHVGPVAIEPIREFFTEFGFGRRIFEKLDVLESLEEMPEPEPWVAEYRAITTVEQLDALVQELSQQSQFSIDTETTHINPRWAELVGISLAWTPGEAYYIPVRSPEGEPSLGEDVVIEKLRPVLEDPQVEKIGQNIKYDLVVLRGAGVNVAGVTFDTMIADHLLAAGGRGHGLDALAERYLGHENIKISQLLGEHRDECRMDEVPLELITPYAAEDADVPLRLAAILGPMLEEEKYESLFGDVEVPLVEILAEIEYNGFYVNPDRLAELSEDYGTRMAALEKEIHEIAGHEFNIASPKQLATVLFEQLQLPIIKKTKTGPSTDVSVLQELAPMHDLPARMIDYRQLAKLKSAYLDTLPELICPKTNRLHTSLNQVVTATGRLSSQDPNLQTIPIRTQQGREIRSAFQAGQPGWQLLAADYSQIELRMLAHFSQDEALVGAFENDEDIHSSVASQVFDVPPGEVTSEMRRRAKAVNFGVIYGQSPFGLGKSLGIPTAEAAEFIQSYFDRYPGVVKFMEITLAECYKKGYVETILGRRRMVQGVRPADKRGGPSDGKTLPERTAINTVIQGSAADLIKQAMLEVFSLLKHGSFHAKIILQIHDELVFETPSEEITELGRIVRQGMTAAGSLAVPLKVDISIGSDLAHCEDLNLPQ